MKTITRYAAMHSQARKGELSFLCHNQQHWSTSLKKVIEEAHDLEIQGYEGGQMLILELTIKVIQKIKCEEFREEVV